MTTVEILERFQHVPNRGDFAPFSEAIRAAVAQRDAITPELIATVERAAVDPAQFEKPDDCRLPFAINLLAQFREQRARDALVRLLSLPGDESRDFLGDMVTSNTAAVLASVSGGDPAPLLRLALDEDVNEFVRAEAIEGLLVQAEWGERSREAALDNLRKLFHTLARPGNSFVWAALVGAICNYGAPELEPEIRQAFAEGLPDEEVVGDLKAVLKELAAPEPCRQDGSRRRNAPIDAANACSEWGCFHDDALDKAWDKVRKAACNETRNEGSNPAWGPAWGPAWNPVREEAQFQRGQAIATGDQPYHAPAKPGRNDPCPCGSGRKYKKCCGPKEQSAPPPPPAAPQDPKPIPHLTAYHEVCPEPGLREIRSVHVLERGGELPAGEYSFVEYYCTDPTCDCRRVLLQVWTPTQPGEVLATINFGWENAAFYTDWMHGDAEAGREITDADLDPMNPQSKHSDLLLNCFQTLLRPNPEYVARLSRHYNQFKEAIRTGTAGLHRPPGPNDGCSCGSGRRYSKCCGAG